MKPPHSVPAEKISVGETSALAERAAISTKQARVYAGQWFAAFGALAGFFCGAVALVLSLPHPNCAGLIAFPLIGACAAYLPGAEFGSKMLIKTERPKPLLCGTEVVFGANTVIGVSIGCFCALIGLFTQQWISLLLAPLLAVLAALLSFIITAVFTIPLGMTAGWLLARQRTVLLSKGGCAIHGYREGGAE